jgi:hypothetical protein
LNGFDGPGAQEEQAAREEHRRAEEKSPGERSGARGQG